MIENLLMYTCAKHCHKRWSSDKAIAKIKRCSFFLPHSVCIVELRFRLLQAARTAEHVLFANSLRLRLRFVVGSINNADCESSLVAGGGTPCSTDLYLWWQTAHAAGHHWCPPQRPVHPSRISFCILRQINSLIVQPGRPRRQWSIVRRAAIMLVGGWRRVHRHA